MSKSREYFATTRANEIMSREVFTCVAREKAAAVAQSLVARGVSGAPVVSNNGICLGVISLKDMSKASAGELGAFGGLAGQRPREHRRREILPQVALQAGDGFQPAPTHADCVAGGEV